MLFNSYEFLFCFLPLTLLGFSVLSSRGSRELAMVFLVIASLFFYGWWNPRYLVLIAFSMIFNFAVGRLIVSSYGSMRRIILTIGVFINLALLAYYKYANFFIDNINALTGTEFTLGPIVLPLAISFFTFQQIAYLADAYKGITEEYSFRHYALFVTFFPQLIAGPIVHHREMLPQFANSRDEESRRMDIAAGLAIFSIGLFKKAVLADGIAAYSSPIFTAASTGADPSFFHAWGGALGYTMQLYFDFSGYSDMAIGAARLFGINLPINFNSPYKSRNIVDFWRRWHITLSRFLRDYLYIALGGNRRGSIRRYANLATTMLLGGLWHGAGWTFVVWGALHGGYLVINHAWHHLCSTLTLARRLSSSRIWPLIAWGITFLAVIIGWVYFRASDFGTANRILAGMFGLNGVSIPGGIGIRLGDFGESLRSLGLGFDNESGSKFIKLYLWIGALLPIAVFAPNCQEIMGKFDSSIGGPHDTSSKPLVPRWRPTTNFAIATGLVTAVGILALSSVSEFLYFQF